MTSTSPYDQLPEAVQRTPVDGDAVVGALSPSRAGDFVECPLMYRFRTIDRLPEPYSPQAVRGTLVHKVLEDLFLLPAQERDIDRASALLRPSWEALLEIEPELSTLFSDEAVGMDEAAWWASCAEVLEVYFTLEDPRLLEPASRETYLESLLDSGLLLRGIVDRIDIAPDGRVRIVDYKTGRSPSERYEARALFQMKFYALLVWRTRGVLPTVLTLLYLGDGQRLSYAPDELDLLATERKVRAVWEAIATAHQTGDWQPNPGPRCGWCSHKALCPAYGGTPPPLPEPQVERLLTVLEPPPPDPR